MVIVIEDHYNHMGKFMPVKNPYFGTTKNIF